MILSESKSLLNNIEINIEYTRIRVTSSYAIHLYSFSLKLFLSLSSLLHMIPSKSIIFFLFPLFSLTFLLKGGREEEAIRQFYCIQAGSCHYNECIKAYMPCTCLADIWNHVDSMVAVNEL